MGEVEVRSHVTSKTLVLSSPQLVYDREVSKRRSYASYNDGCAAAHALDVVGERWALLVVRELVLGPKRFSDLQRDVMGISATALTQRLRDLERQGVLEQEALPSPARVPVYRLTAWGQ